MCGRYTLASGLDDLVEVFDVAHVAFDAWPPRFNVAPTQDAPVIIQGDGGERRMGLMRWGLVPGWADDPAIGNRMINARSETTHRLSAYREAFRQRRCLVPADGFYEWAAEPDARGKSVKIPHWIHRPDRSPFAFAGLWERWRPRSGGDPLVTFTILTTEPNAPVAPLHDRMPIVLPDARAWASWLDPGAAAEDLRALLRPAPDDYLEEWAVSRAVSRPDNEGPELIEPAEPAGG